MFVAQYLPMATVDARRPAQGDMRWTVEAGRGDVGAGERSGCGRVAEGVDSMFSDSHA